MLLESQLEWHLLGMVSLTLAIFLKVILKTHKINW